MDELIDSLIQDLDPADRIVLSGAISLGLGVTGVIGANSAALGGSIAIGATVGVVGAVAVAPGLIVLGIYATTVTEKEKQDWLEAANQTVAAVKIATRFGDYLEDFLSETTGLPKEVKYLFEAGFPSEKPPSAKRVQELAKNFLRDAAYDFSEDLLETSKKVTGTGAGDDYGSSRSSLRAPGPMCQPGDPTDGGEKLENHRVPEEK